MFTIFQTQWLLKITGHFTEIVRFICKWSKHQWIMSHTFLKLLLCFYSWKKITALKFKGYLTLSVG